jgi:hypothetical protein
MTEGLTTPLSELLREAAASLDEVDEQPASADGLEWSIGGRVFATVTNGRAEFRLDPMVAAAAMRTPDTSASARGADWVAFAPSVLDQHAVDRATAWLTSAWRRADGES